MITLVDTSELKRPTQRKLHAAWRELQAERVLATPGVADELAPLAANVLWREGPSEAERTLQKYPNPERLVELTRRHLPSPTISTDRAHPSFPERPGTTFLKADRTMGYRMPPR